MSISGQHQRLCNRCFNAARNREFGLVRAERVRRFRARLRKISSLQTNGGSAAWPRPCSTRSSTLMARGVGLLQQLAVGDLVGQRFDAIERGFRAVGEQIDRSVRAYRDVADAADRMVQVALLLDDLAAIQTQPYQAFAGQVTRGQPKLAPPTIRLSSWPPFGLKKRAANKEVANGQ